MKFTVGQEIVAYVMTPRLAAEDRAKDRLVVESIERVTVNGFRVSRAVFVNKHGKRFQGCYQSRDRHILVHPISELGQRERWGYDRAIDA